MAPVQATRRLQKELQNFQKDPPEGIIAEPKENDILTWYYALEGPKDTPYREGIYVGKLVFPPEYPWKPPSIYMLTPSGRFEVNRKLCLSMSDFHPESWNPIWAVATIIQGVQSFMASEEITTGGIQTSTERRIQFAKASREFNQEHFNKLFDGNMDAALERAREAAAAAQRHRAEARPREKKTLAPTSKVKPTEKCTDEERSAATDEVELNEAEKEKRRKRNAKKRAKQKQKKAASAENGEGQEKADDG